MSKLTVQDHNRDIVGFKYIYPVISRRSGGLSIGINFNTNNACNWQCVYCQVPDLKVGAAPELDLPLLVHELDVFLHDVLQGTFYERFEIELEYRVIKDIAISGNGEPTSVKGFSQAIKAIIEQVEQAMIPEPFHYVLISNGSLIHHSDVQAGLRLLNQYQGQVWFKVDSALESGRVAINHAGINTQKQEANLLICAQLCDTWVQTCVLNYTLNQQAVGLSTDAEQAAYLALLARVNEEVSLQGVMLYSIARPSLQPEAELISRVSLEQINGLAEKIRKLGMVVKVSL